MVLTVENGFQHILDVAHRIHESCSDEECYGLSLELFKHPAYQVRMLSVVLLGYAGVDNEKALSFLKERVSRDENWRVQEMLAKSFDFICKERGYERTLPLIAEWLADGHPNVVRAVTEGLRIWTSRPYFKEHPLEAVAFLSRVERGNSHINLKRLNQLCDLLDVSEGYLLNGASSSSENYLDKEFTDLIKSVSPEKQKLIYNVAKAIAETDMEEEEK